MKRKQIIFMTIVPFMVMIAGCNFNQLNLTQDKSDENELIDETLSEFERKLPWDYPVKPGMPEWKLLILSTNYYEKVY